MIDLRSDSSSTPTDAMRRAMASAPVGNDAFGEDPSVNELERRGAALMGKEAALYVASGTMANLISVLAQAGPGDAVLAGRQSHLIRFEAGASARFGGVSLVPLADPLGRISLEEMEDFLTQPMSLRPRLLALENTHNSSGGLALRLDEMAAYAALARRHGLHVHLDGARILNAATFLQVPASAIASYADSVCFCLSKGLSAPIGSILAGSRDFIARAREVRFQLGGQMRQLGIVAAAGLVALDTMLPQHEQDHRNARMLAEGLAAIPGLTVDLDRVETNMVLFDVSRLATSAQEFETRLEANGVYASVFSTHVIRYITYRNIGQAEVERTLEITAQVAASFRP